VRRTVRNTVIGLVAATCAAFVPVAYAHHSFSLDYFEERSTTIEGSVEEFLYRNPHAILKVRVTDAQGTALSYAAEWAGAGRLGRLGITAETLKPGDIVRIVGAPGRIESENRIHLKQIVRPSDGWTWGNGGRRR
jgi:hypothetical protein